ncbi:hypothetical protein K8R66_05165 [bacterium]|nr:hypothetical protein [bacterium]
MKNQIDNKIKSNDVQNTNKGTSWKSLNEKEILTGLDKIDLLKIYRINTEGVTWKDKDKHIFIKEYSVNTLEGKKIINKLKFFLKNSDTYKGKECSCEGFPVYRFSGGELDIYITNYEFMWIEKNGERLKDGWQHEKPEVIKELNQLLSLMELKL